MCGNLQNCCILQCTLREGEAFSEGLRALNYKRDEKEVKYIVISLTHYRYRYIDLSRNPKINPLMEIYSKFYYLFILLNYTVKVNVKCTLQQALRLCTGRMAHRGSISIALLFLDHGTRRR